MIRTGQKMVIYKPKGKSSRYREVNNMSFTQKQQFAGRPVSTSSASNTASGGGAASPATTSPASADTGSGDWVTYVVKQGDTLWEIARKYPGTTETDIARLNNITNSSKIRPGQVIRVKPII